MNDILKTPLGDILKNKKRTEVLRALLETEPVTVRMPPKAKPTRKIAKPSVIAAAPKAKANVASPEIVPVVRDGKEVLLFKPGFYNHQWRGWLYANTKKIGVASFKWDPDAKGFIVEPERLPFLLTGLRSTYGGSKLIMGEQTIDL